MSQTLQAVFEKGILRPLEPLALRERQQVNVTICETAASEPGTVEASASLEQRFRALAQQWKDDTRFLSSVHEMVSHPAYLRIIGMGQLAVPLLLEELRRAPDHWFVALQAITGVNPIPAAASGDVDKMAQAWLSWAER